MSRFPLALVLAAAVAAILPSVGLGGDEPAAVSLADAPANTWVKALVEKTGGRDQPAFVYVPAIGRFGMLAGMQARGGNTPRHYDTEEFDPAAMKWTNAYPPGTETGRPASGPLDEAYTKARAKMGYNGRELFYRDGDYVRLGAGGQWLKTWTTYDWCAAVGTGKVYLCLQNKTLRYDAKARTWEDLGAGPPDPYRVWGAMAYDPVNKEVLLVGGGSGSAAPSTLAYDVEKGAWRALAFGSAAMKALHAEAGALCWQAKALLGAVCNRFAVTETESEAKADLAKQAGTLAAATLSFAATVRKADLTGSEKTAADVAVERLASAAAAVTAVGPNVGGTITPEIIGEVRSAREIFEKVVDALAVEPPGRARSQIAYDPEHKKIVLFGGDGLDRTLSDTWVYDCATRTWAQRFPKQCPTPRAGHILAWLPKAKKIMLAGGYSRTWLAQEVWTYDVAADVWRLVLHVPLKSMGRHRGSYSPNTPPVTARQTQVGAVNDDDVLVCVTKEGRSQRTTWVCKVDASKADAAATAEHAVASGTYTWNRMSPAAWEAVANPDAAKTAALLEALPVNQWTSLPFAKYAPGATNRWGTTAYDAKRHQFLFWGGGHATSHENDVAHYSVRGGCWTLGYHPDDPIEVVYAAQPTPLSYHDRAHVPVHAYRAYCYDPTADAMFYLDRAYNPAVREWEPKGLPGLQHRGTMRTQMAPTPKGAVTYSDRGLFRFDAAAGAWKKLPWDGPSFGRIWCDGDGLCYDSKRDCLWMASGTIFRYDFATGKATRLAVKKPKALGKYALWAEQVYLPDADLILLMRLYAKPDGTLANVAWSPAENAYYWVDLPYVEKGKTVVFKNARRAPFSWQDALAYDADLGLVLLNNSSLRKVWALKFDVKTATMEKIEVE